MVRMRFIEQGFRGTGLRGVRIAPALASIVAALLFASPAAANVHGYEVKEYMRDFGVRAAAAEAKLEVQDRAAESGLIEQVEQDLGDDYAGLWFDNAAGEFVVPVLAPSDHLSIGEAFAGVGLGGDYRTTTAQFSWAQLEAAHEGIDESLHSFIEDGLVKTSLDPRTNAVIVSVAASAGNVERGEIASRMAGLGAKVEIRQEDIERFEIDRMSCDIEAKSCGYPLRGGVVIRDTNETVLCSAGFKAIGKADGKRFMLTAGHCAKNWPTFVAYDRDDPGPEGWFTEKKIGPTYAVASSGSGHEWASINATGSEWDGSPWPTEVALWGIDNQRVINAESASYMGEFVCHSGEWTGGSCGYVTRLDATETFTSGDVVYHMTEVQPICGHGGDSGGPVLAGNTALGIFIGGSGPECGGLGVYVEIDEVSDALGVTVAPRIGPPPQQQPILGEDDNASGPHVVGQITGSLDVFYRTPSGGLGHNWYQTGGGGWASAGLPGSLASPPHPVVQENGTVDVFYRTPSGGLGHNWYAPGIGWASGGLAGSVASNPHPVAQSEGTIDVLYRTASGTLGHNWYQPGGEWHYNTEPGSVASDPYSVAQDNGTVDTFFRTPSGGLGHAWTQGGSWSEQDLSGASLASSSDPHPVFGKTIDVFWRTPSNGLGHAWIDGAGWHVGSLPGSLASEPHAVAQPNGAVDVFYRTPSGGLGHDWYEAGGSWASGNLPGSLTSEPYPVAQANGTIDVFYRNTSGGLGHNWYQANGAGWVSAGLPGAVASIPHAVAQSNGTVDVFYRTSDGSLGHNWYDPGTGWLSGNLPGSIATDPPKATTGAATNVNSTSATLNGTVNPEGSATSYYFEYGLTTSYGSKKPTTAEGLGSGLIDLPVSQGLSGLAAATTYHYRIVAEGPAGTTKGADKTFTTSYSATVNSDGPVSYWRLGESSGTSAADERGANPGTYQNSPTLGAASLLATDTANKAVTFDGTNDSVKVPSATSLQLTSSLSLEAWIKPTSLPASGSFASILTKAESYSLQFNGPRLEFTIMQNGVRQRLQAPEGTIATGQTYHVVGTFDGNTQRLYVNGTQVASTGLSGSATTNTTPLYIGSWNGSEEFFKGTIDEAAVYGTVLSATRVAAHYQVGSGSAPPPPSYSATVNSDGPVSYWRLGESSGTSAADERGANPGTYQNSPTLGAASLLATDTANKAVTFDGTNDSVKVPSATSLQLTSSLSLEAWIKPTSLPASGSFASILTKAESYSLQFNGPRLEFTIMQNGVRQRLQAPEGTIATGQTYHVVGTFDGNTQRLYVNGTQVASTGLSGSATTNTTPLYIGSWNGSEEFFKGTIDEAAVYGTVLSATRVAAHYQVGSGS
jgi:hypothetical protein